MSSATIVVNVSDAAGASASSQVVVTTDVVSITSIVVTPANAPAGTNRTLTVVATSSSGSALSAAATSAGITFTPVAGQPAGTFVWNFTF
jgi:hypothetical protein